MRLSTIISGTTALALLAMAGPVNAQQSGASTSSSAPSPWQVSETVEALTGARTVTAVLLSDAPVANMLGNPDHPALFLRCQENVLAVYISWPQVLTYVEGTFGAGPQTMVLWRVDEQPISANFWPRSTDGTATGKFTTKPAAKLMEKLFVAKRLAVRLTGSSTQDAAFSLGDIQAVAARVGASCGLKWTVTP